MEDDAAAVDAEAAVDVVVAAVDTVVAGAAESGFRFRVGILVFYLWTRIWKELCPESRFQSRRRHHAASACLIDKRLDCSKRLEFVWKTKTPRDLLCCERKF